MRDLPILPARERFERTVCDCVGCKIGCHTMPGCASVGDVENIAAHLGQKPDREFLIKNFRLSTAAKVGRYTSDGMAITIVPTITPAQREDGRCVFLTDDDQCSVHPVSPIGCSHCDVHQTKYDGDIVVGAMLREILQDREDRGPYFKACAALIEAGKTSPDVEGRRRSFELQLRLAREAGLVAPDPEPELDEDDLELLEILGLKA
jgi:Fe-S-cluster containining protein